MFAPISIYLIAFVVNTYSSRTSPNFLLFSIPLITFPANFYSVKMCFNSVTGPVVRRGFLIKILVKSQLFWPRSGTSVPGPGPRKCFLN